MATKQFDSLFEQLLNELDIGAEYAGFRDVLKSGIKERESEGKDTYVYEIVKQALNKNSDEVVDIIAKPLYDLIFPGGVFAAKGDESTQLTRLQNTISASIPEVINILKNDEKIREQLQNAPKIMRKALHDYTARITRSIATPIFKITTSGNKGEQAPSEQEVANVVSGAIKKEVEDKGKPAAPKAPKAFRPSSRVDYTFEPDVKAGTLSEEELRVYGAVDTGESYTGKDLLDYLKDEVKLEPREDLNISKLTRILTTLMSKGVLTSSVKPSEEGEIGALERPYHKEFNLDDFPEIKDKFEELEREKSYSRDY